MAHKRPFGARKAGSPSEGRPAAGSAGSAAPGAAAQAQPEPDEGAAPPAGRRTVFEPTPGYGLWLPLSLAVVAGLVMFAAFPPVDFGELAWLALVLFFFAITQCRRPLWGFFVGLVYGVVFFGLLMLYIARFGLLPWALIALVEGLFMAVMGLLAAGTNSLRLPGLRALGLAALWVLFEYLRSHRGAISLSLGDVYYTQWNQLSLLQVASIGGGHLVTFFIALLSAALAIAAAAWLPLPLYRPQGLHIPHARQAARSLLIAYALFFGVFFWGSWAYHSGERLLSSLAPHKGYEVGYVQGAVPGHATAQAGDVVRAADSYFGLTKTLPDNVKMIVWPETALPVILDRSPQYRERIAAVARRRKCYMLVGANETAPGGRLYNTLFLFGPSGKIINRYRKVDLVIFGEYVPWRKELPWLNRYPIRSFDYAPGPGFKVMKADGLTFGALICFESLFSDFTRDLCQAGAQAIVYATSDVWAQGSYEVYQHSRTAVIRAVEARRYVVRVATDGVSEVVSPFGDQRGVLPVGMPGATSQEIYPVTALSTYDQWGDTPLMVFCCLAWLTAYWESGRSRRRR